MQLIVCTCKISATQLASHVSLHKHCSPEKVATNSDDGGEERKSAMYNHTGSTLGWPCLILSGFVVLCFCISVSLLLIMYSVCCSPILQWAIYFVLLYGPREPRRHTVFPVPSPIAI